MTGSAVSGSPVAVVDRLPSPRDAVTLPVADLCVRLGTDPERGLTDAEVLERRRRWGANVLVSHGVRTWTVLGRQLRSPLLLLLVVTATASFFVGRRSDAVIIGVIIALSVGLGFANEYRAERAAAALHDQIAHQIVAVRNGRAQRVGVTGLVPGDVVDLHAGEVVPADVRLVRVEGLECDESVLTGESVPVAKTTRPPALDASPADAPDLARMGTTVHGGDGRGIVVATGASTGFGSIAAGLGRAPLETEFQVGLRRFSLLLATVAGALVAAVLVVDLLVLHRPALETVLFALAIAVGITPQLLPAVVSTGLAAGARAMRRRRVLVKRLVCMEDLGNVDLLFTDKTGTLTAGRITFMRAVPTGDADAAAVLGEALWCTANRAVGTGVGGNPLDDALWASPAADGIDLGAGRVAAGVPFDHDRRLTSVVVVDPAGRARLVVKGAPETVLARCRDVDDDARAALAAEFEAGNRVLAVAVRPFPPTAHPTPRDENGLRLLGLLVFLDPPKPDAAASLRRLAALGVTVKVVTGDNPVVAERVCTELGLDRLGTLTGEQIARLDDDALRAAVGRTTVFARVSPQDKARVVTAGAHGGHDVAFLGDGVNDALALHTADVGISVDTATDVAKDAADVILLDKDLDVLADGVTEGRRIFANTVKYVLMGTSSNFGNMFSAAGASLFLSFLPMLPSQVLLGNLLYDTGQLAIPTDRVDEDQIRRPAHWDIALIRRFMLVFGPLSSAFDGLTFVILLRVLHAGAPEFRTGWFVESLATQTLVVFAIRTRAVPFTRSRPGLLLTLSVLAVVAVAALLPLTPAAAPLGFTPLPGSWYLLVAGLVLAYLVLVEVAVRVFHRHHRAGPPRRRARAARHVARRAMRFSSALRPAPADPGAGSAGAR